MGLGRSAWRARGAVLLLLVVLLQCLQQGALAAGEIPRPLDAGMPPKPWGNAGSQTRRGLLQDSNALPMGSAPVAEDDEQQQDDSTTAQMDAQVVAAKQSPLPLAVDDGDDDVEDAEAAPPEAEADMDDDAPDAASQSKDAGSLSPAVPPPPANNGNPQDAAAAATAAGTPFSALMPQKDPPSAEDSADVDPPEMPVAAVPAAAAAMDPSSALTPQVDPPSAEDSADDDSPETPAAAVLGAADALDASSALTPQVDPPSTEDNADVDPPVLSAAAIPTAPAALDPSTVPNAPVPPNAATAFAPQEDPPRAKDSNSVDPLVGPAAAIPNAGAALEPSTVPNATLPSNFSPGLESAPPYPPPPQDDGGTQVGVIVGSVVGAVAALTVMAVLATVWFRRRRRREKRGLKAPAQLGGNGGGSFITGGFLPGSAASGRSFLSAKSQLQAHSVSASASGASTPDPGSIPALRQPLTCNGHSIVGVQTPAPQHPLDQAHSASSSLGDAAPFFFGSAVSATGSTLDAPSLEQLPWGQPDVLKAEDIEISRRPDGTPWTLGSGSYGIVYRGMRDGVQPVAVKVLQGMDHPRTRAEFVREVTLLRSCRDVNVVQFLGACFSGEKALLVTELLELGDLWRCAAMRSGGGAGGAGPGERAFGWWGRGAKAAIDVAKGLHYLHARRIIHLDLKSANVLLTRDGTAKLADVGMSRTMTRTAQPSSAATTTAAGEESESGSRAAAGGGTFAWSAPEVLAGRACTEKADIFSYGVVLWEICTGEAPVRGAMRAVRVPEECPEGVAELYRECTAEDPAQRPSARDIVLRLQRLAPDAARRRAASARRQGSGSAALQRTAGESGSADRRLAELWAAAASSASAGGLDAAEQAV